MRTIIVILGVLLVLLQIQVWRQFAYVAELEQRVEAQRDENRRLAERNNALGAEVRDLKSGLDAVEERARAELGLIRAGENFYMVVEPEDLNPDDARALEELRASAARRPDDAERRGESVEPDEGG
jgi:cell division protein FtsB